MTVGSRRTARRRRQDVDRLRLEDELVMIGSKTLGHEPGERALVMFLRFEADGEGPNEVHSKPGS